MFMPQLLAAHSDLRHRLKYLFEHSPRKLIVFILFKAGFTGGLHGSNIEITGFYKTCLFLEFSF